MNSAKQLSLSNLSEDEKNARAAAAVTVYGVGTKSYNSSTEKREMDRQRAETTAKYHAGELKIHDCSKAFLLCYCRSFHHGHSPELHRRRAGSRDRRSSESGMVGRMIQTVCFWVGLSLMYAALALGLRWLEWRAQAKARKR